ncbi:hypothetical protein Tco_0226866 [Tanacetum coccineum]
MIRTNSPWESTETKLLVRLSYFFDLSRIPCLIINCPFTLQSSKNSTPIDPPTPLVAHIFTTHTLLLLSNLAVSLEQCWQLLNESRNEWEQQQLDFHHNYDNLTSSSSDLKGVLLVIQVDVIISGLAALDSTGSKSSETCNSPCVWHFYLLSQRILKTAALCWFPHLL